MPTYFGSFGLSGLRGLNDIRRMAIHEAGSSELPGGVNGPADAYRHILWAAEMTRRYGEISARLVLNGKEVAGWLGGQPSEQEDMDRYNNEIGIAIGRTVRSWSEVVERARQQIDPSAPNGETGGGKWLPETDPNNSDNNW